MNWLGKCEIWAAACSGRTRGGWDWLALCLSCHGHRWKAPGSQWFAPPLCPFRSSAMEWVQACSFLYLLPLLVFLLFSFLICKSLHRERLEVKVQLISLQTGVFLISDSYRLKSVSSEASGEEGVHEGTAKGPCPQYPVDSEGAKSTPNSSQLQVSCVVNAVIIHRASCLLKEVVKGGAGEA